MNVVDTSAWLEFFSGGGNAAAFSAPIKQTQDLIVPTICIYEISKVILRESDENHLIQVLAALHQGQIVALTPSLASAAAKISLANRLPMADSIIYATAKLHAATTWTQDKDFEMLSDVKYLPKQKK
ncbi:MAG: VapC toxin family PIN domain ribonuclease [Cellvibrionales bacterium]|nr:MAG: VapC toxin family PIN domain ribonuclease [Cellvibrionales bacterium]